ncbi:helix-turn-helix transcriptional regulator [Streptococcus hyovaginalis]|uniref:helix-turn-helix domain-containing protein n=1 Tax=Streptococcus hyovaginalis TaxID=149015 RepID=UPI002A7FB211|nr:helix-turn-helix transcriptional regulator [Streptococcus hyovaginalis]MDY4510620.1 helix-turn-helix transcriptional regulator [Streptococcus hyovaginalis]
MTHLAQQLKSLRTAKKMSQDDLAEKLYISRQAISKWETDEATPDLDKLVQLADIFKVSLDFLVLGKEPEKEIVIESQMNAWQFLAGYWWLLFPVLGMLSWFLKSIVAIFN